MEGSRYITVNNGEVKVSVMTFSGGEIQVKVSEIPFNANIVANLECSDAIIELLLVVDALKRGGAKLGSITIPYFPYARQDRVCNKGEALSIAVIADLLKGFESVVTLDPHSDVLPALMPNLTVIPQHEIAAHIPCLEEYVLISPDAGAEKKTLKLAAIHGNRVIVATKIRDVTTGNITGTQIHASIDPNCKYLIVDDICDGGRTFVELANLLKVKEVQQINLYVTHGIFSQGYNSFKGLFDFIYFTNSFNPKDKAFFRGNNLWVESNSNFILYERRIYA